MPSCRRDAIQRSTVRDFFGDKAVTMTRLGVRPIPSRAHRRISFCNQPIVARPRPSIEIHQIAWIGDTWAAVGVGLSGRQTAASPSIVARKVKSSGPAERY